MKDLTTRLGGDREYDEVRGDGKTMGEMPQWPHKGSGSSGAHHIGMLQEDQKFSSNEKGFENAGALGAMPFKEVGSMAMDDYGADLGPNATNTLEKFDADSDSMDLRRVLPRKASEVL